MFLRSGTLIAFASVLLLTALSVESQAGDRFRQQTVIKRLNIKNNVRFVDRSVTVNINRLKARHRMHRQANTYSGDVMIYHRRNVGTWSYGTVSSGDATVRSVPRAKIIDVEKAKNSCSMENGVCVIRH